jgi:hypothetical protein
MVVRARKEQHPTNIQDKECGGFLLFFGEHEYSGNINYSVN